MKRTVYWLMVAWIVAGGICGVRYRIVGKNADERITREEADSMVREAREETRVAVLQEMDEKLAKENDRTAEAAGAGWDSAEGAGGAGGNGSVEGAGSAAGAGPDGSAEEAGDVVDKSQGTDTKGNSGENAKDSEGGPSESEDTKSTGKKTKKMFYMATVNGASNLRIRDGASDLSAELGVVAEGTSGYVIKKGEEWTLLAIDGQIGYMSTRYLVIEEIEEEDYPEKLRSLSEVNVGEEISF